MKVRCCYVTSKNPIYASEYDIFIGSTLIGYAIEECSYQINNSFIMPMWNNDKYKSYVHLCHKIPISYEKDKDNRSFESTLMTIENYTTTSKICLANLNEPFVLNQDHFKGFYTDTKLVYNKNILIHHDKYKIEIGISCYNIIKCNNCQERFEFGQYQYIDNRIIKYGLLDFIRDLE